MPRVSFPWACIAFSCMLSTGISVTLMDENSTESGARTSFRGESRPAVQPPSPSPPTTSNVRKGTDSQVLSRKKVARYDFVPIIVGDPTQPPAILHSHNLAKTYEAVMKKAADARLYEGPSEPGVSRHIMKYRFERWLYRRVTQRLAQSGGGLIEEFGARDPTKVHQCMERPALTLSDVRDLARESFGIADFEVSYPPCTGVGKRTSCTYETGTCCTRPQTEFLGRYYDTAVAAMALGATQDEAFAPFLHARILAYMLQACDPKLNPKGMTAANSFMYARSDIPSGYSLWAPLDLSLIAFPVAYEVLYELYNTMLIERMRSRGSVRLPTDTEMRALNDAVYYKKLIARVAPLDRDLNPGAVFPSSADFTAAGLTIATSRMAKSSERSVENPGDFELHPSLRFTTESVDVYESRTGRWRSMSYTYCNSNLFESPFYPFKFQSHVWSKWQGCCAKECIFMQLYGGTFSTGSANCCSGCNRFRCQANSDAVANHLADLSTVEATSKYNVGAEEYSFTV